MSELASYVGYMAEQSVTDPGACMSTMGRQKIFFSKGRVLIGLYLVGKGGSKKREIYIRDGGRTKQIVRV